MSILQSCSFCGSFTPNHICSLFNENKKENKEQFNENKEINENKEQFNENKKENDEENKEMIRKLIDEYNNNEKINHYLRWFQEVGSINGIKADSFTYLHAIFEVLDLSSGCEDYGNLTDTCIREAIIKNIKNRIEDERDKVLDKLFQSICDQLNDTKMKENFIKLSNKDENTVENEILNFIDNHKYINFTNYKKRNHITEITNHIKKFL